MDILSNEQLTSSVEALLIERFNHAWQNQAKLHNLYRTY